MKKKLRVLLGMSGGVDSSVAALLLQKQGFEVIGLFIKSWEDSEDQNTCPAVQDYEDVVLVANKLKIPFYTANLVEEYQNFVFKPFLQDLEKGLTPNPDIFCNREVKFKILNHKSTILQTDYIATGHYARTICKDHKTYLTKAKDPNKDQSYFLYTLKENLLKKVLFPVGDQTKSTIRQIAKQHDLPVAQKKDSTGICFIGKRNFKSFIEQYIQKKTGILKDTKGNKIGSHDGISFYTIGQRKGLNIGGPGEAWFVVDKELRNNTLIVEQGKQNPHLYHNALIATNFSWVVTPPDSFPFSCHAKIRYRQPPTPACIKTFEENNNKALIQFAEPQRAITPGQAIVFYQNDICLGGGTIIKPVKQV